MIVDSIKRAGRTDLYLRGYHLVGTTYALLAADARGWLWLEAVQVWLGMQDDEVYCYDRDERQMGDYATVVVQLATEYTARVAAEAQAVAAEAVAAEAQAAREREARMVAEAHAQAAQNQAAAAEAQAARERESRMSIEAQLRAMQEEIRRLRGEE